jgi:hypothetical protein
MAILNFTITDAGKVAVAQAGQLGPVVLESIGVGSGAYTPSTGQLALQNETKRLTPDGTSTPVPGTIHFTITDDTAASYTVNEVGIFTSTGILFAVYSQTDPLAVKSAGSVMLLAIDLVLSNTPAGSVIVGNTGFTYSQASESVKGVGYVATQAEVDAGVSDVKFVTPKKLYSQSFINNFSLGSRTDALVIPTGTTAQRPATPVSGMLRMNLTLGEPEWWDARTSTWQPFRSREYPVDWLIVAGGGSGGAWGGGGGGGGGVRTSFGTVSGGGAGVEAQLSLKQGQAHFVIVGAGAAQGSTIRGNDSSLGAAQPFLLWSSGGGGGASYSPVTAASGGGSGGGGMWAYQGTSGVPGAGTAGQGFSGGTCTWANSGFHATAGGGGAAAAGGSPASVNSPSGNGGDGVSNAILGTAYYFAGGGGGSYYIGGRGGNGGLGGGGGGSGHQGTAGNGGGGGLNVGANGVNTVNQPGGAGGANTGGGGGGGAHGVAQNGGPGGSGIVVIRYPGPQRAYGGTVTSVGGFTTHAFYTSGYFTS